MTGHISMGSPSFPRDGDSVQEMELYAEVHRDVTSANYTPIARDACSFEKHVSSRAALSPNPYCFHLQQGMSRLHVVPE